MLNSTSAVPTFAAYVADQYQAHAQLRLKASTWQRRQGTLRRLAARIGNVLLSALDEVWAEDYALARVRTIKPVSVNAELLAVRAVLQHARRRRVIDRVPDIELLPVRDAIRARAWSDEEMDRLLRACDEIAPLLVPLVLGAVNTGMRPTEVIRLTWDHVDMQRRIIYVQATEAGWSPKSGRPREVPISDALAAVIDTQRGKSTTYVFPASHGGPYYKWPQSSWERARKAAGLDGCIYTLRHTYASMFLRETRDMFLLSRILGHKDASVTSRVYSHLLPGWMEGARNAVCVRAFVHETQLELFPATP